MDKWGKFVNKSALEKVSFLGPDPAVDANLADSGDIDATFIDKEGDNGQIGERNGAGVVTFWNGGANIDARLLVIPIQ